MRSRAPGLDDKQPELPESEARGLRPGFQALLPADGTTIDLRTLGAVTQFKKAKLQNHPRLKE